MHLWSVFFTVVENWIVCFTREGIWMVCFNIDGDYMVYFTRYRIEYDGCSKCILLCGKKINLFTCRTETLKHLYVLPLRPHTRLSWLLSLLKSLLEDVVGNRVQLDRRLLHNSFSLLNMGLIRRFLQFGEQPKVTRSHVAMEPDNWQEYCVWPRKKKKVRIRCEECVGALSRWSSQFSIVRINSRFYRTT